MKLNIEIDNNYYMWLTFFLLQLTEQNYKLCRVFTVCFVCSLFLHLKILWFFALSFIYLMSNLIAYTYPMIWRGRCIASYLFFKFYSLGQNFTFFSISKADLKKGGGGHHKHNLIYRCKTNLSVVWIFMLSVNVRACIIICNYKPKLLI